MGSPMRSPSPLPSHYSAWEPIPISPPSRKKKEYWATAQADLRTLNAVPILRSPRNADYSMPGPALLGASSPRGSRTGGVLPRVALPATVTPLPPTHPPGTEPMLALHSLEQWLKHELAPLPRGAPERFTAYRHVFSELIAQLPTHGPLLAEVKRAYDGALRDATAKKPPAAGTEASDSALAKQLVGEPAPRPLQNLHPLQLPAAYYEHQWRRVNDELTLVKSQRQRLRRMVRKLRAVSVEGIHRLHAAGSSDSHAASEAASAARAALEELEELKDDADDKVETDPDKALMAARAVINVQTEEAVEHEVNKLREQLMVTDIRVGSAARLSQRLAQGSLAARLHLEEEVKKANAEMDEFPAAEPTRRAEALSVLLKMLQQQDEHIGHCIKLLAESKSLDGATLRSLAQASS